MANDEASARVIASVGRLRADGELATGEIEQIVADFVSGRVPDYQMSAWLATIACRGLNTAQTAALTRAYVESGERLHLGDIGRTVLDKHSTGGVGDNVSLVAVPVVAACGVSVGKMSGRGLGHAGGTIDKLESIPGLRLDCGAEDMYGLLRDVGMVITGQSDQLVPADRATYELRDVTGTVESIPLIAASIISKKVAVGADGLLLDVKTGTGALIVDRESATLLAETMVDLATAFGLPCRAVLTDMSQPLGYAVGNALEVKEALAVLRGAHVPGLSELCKVVCRLLLQLADPGLTDTAADDQVTRVLNSGSGFEQFMRWARAQGADAHVLARPELLPTASHRTVVTADRDGWVEDVDPRAVGAAALRVGAGRLVHGAALDHSAGVVLRRRVGDRAVAGEPLAEIHYTDRDPEAAVALCRSAFRIGTERPASRPVLLDVLDPARTSSDDLRKV
ncbi:thymidine phosphorylase [Streptomyces sp. NPDC094034]|uniref:thymidine phosphorylase n=1 Tax=Streptomyces sp. NPDC094034 TaxID=3155309 RepID=UPI0033256A42